MRSSRLVNILKTFSKEELKKFEKFTESPYFSRGRNLTPFLNVIKTFHTEFNPDEYSSENIQVKLFPGKEINKQYNNLIKTLSHELIILCEEFLIQTSLRNDAGSRNYYLLDTLRRKKLYSEFEKKYQDAVN